MAEKQDSRNEAYSGERTTEPHQQTGTLNSRNNNVAASTPGAAAPDVEKESDSGIGDAAVNDRKLTDFTSNNSADA